MAVLNVHEAEWVRPDVDTATGVASALGVKVFKSASNESALCTKFGLASADTVTD